MAWLQVDVVSDDGEQATVDVCGYFPKVPSGSLRETVGLLVPPDSDDLPDAYARFVARQGDTDPDGGFV